MSEKNAVQEMLRKRMAATQQASELELGDEFYEKVFRPVSPGSKPMIQEIPVSSLTPSFTTDIGFKPYPAPKLEAFAKQLAEDGLFERIIVRAIPNSNRYEIIAGHNRTEAAKLNEWKTIPAEIIVADDARATSIAIATNLLRRQELTILERGKAYKALDQSNPNWLQEENRSDLVHKAFQQQVINGGGRILYTDKDLKEAWDKLTVAIVQKAEKRISQDNARISDVQVVRILDKVKQTETFHLRCRIDDEQQIRACTTFDFHDHI